MNEQQFDLRKLNTERINSLNPLVFSINTRLDKISLATWLSLLAQVVTAVVFYMMFSVQGVVWYFIIGGGFKTILFIGSMVCARIIRNMDYTLIQLSSDPDVVYEEGRLKSSSGNMIAEMKINGVHRYGEKLMPFLNSTKDAKKLEDGVDGYGAYLVLNIVIVCVVAYMLDLTYAPLFFLSATILLKASYIYLVNAALKSIKHINILFNNSGK